MRNMRETTYNAIKNRVMTGVNRFAQKVEIEGEPVGYSDVQNSKTLPVSADSDWSDYCHRSDGKILYARLWQNKLYLSVIESEEVMRTVDYSGNGGTLFYTYEAVDEPHCFSLINLRDGSILLFINAIRLVEGSTSELLVYKSESGLGDDFVLLSTIFQKNISGLSDSYDTDLVSKAYESSNGDLFVMATVPSKYDSYQGFAITTGTVFKSIDGGLTWTIKYIDPDTSIVWGPIRWGHMGSIIRIGSFMMVTYSYEYTEYTTSGIISYDGGENWFEVGFSQLPASGSRGHKAQIEFAYDGANLFMTLGLPDPSVNQGITVVSIYRMKTLDGLSYGMINNFNNWEKVMTGPTIDILRNLSFTISKSGSFQIMFWEYGHVMKGFSAKREYLDSKFKTASITISKSNGGASTASITVDNTNGVVNPRNQDGPLFGILNLNKRVIIKQGYGDDLVTSFTGLIDSIAMTTYPQMASVELRDMLKRALDQTATKDGKRTIKYPKQPVENIVGDLCALAGLSVDVIEPTGISIEKEFSWQSYADAFQFLSDIASFEFGMNEEGNFYFRRDYQPESATVSWSFEEGVDIIDLSYEINDSDLYYSVKVHGKNSDGNSIWYTANFLDAPQFNILPQKVLKIDATEASTIDELRKIAQRAIATMRSRTRVIEFSSVGIPHLQVGDFIQIFESSTNSHEIYRISSLSFSMNKDSFAMKTKAFYYGDAIVPDELPSDVAVQTPNPTLNIIPNMTSNSAPSGKARSSTVYKLYNIVYSAWRAFNTSNTDYFWDASTKMAWLEYEFPLKTIVDKYSIKARQDLTWNKAMPKTWTFQAFDGEKWITLDSRTNQTGWGIYETRYFNFTNTTPYAKYRINISANNGYVRTQIEKMGMFYRGGQ